MWEIVDNMGTLYSGNEDDMKTIFQQIKDGIIEEKWSGDLKLIQVHFIHR